MAVNSASWIWASRCRCFSAGAISGFGGSFGVAFLSDGLLLSTGVVVAGADSSDDLVVFLGFRVDFGGFCAGSATAKSSIGGSPCGSSAFKSLESELLVRFRKSANVLLAFGLCGFIGPYSVSKFLITNAHLSAAVSTSSLAGTVNRAGFDANHSRLIAALACQQPCARLQPGGGSVYCLKRFAEQS